MNYIQITISVSNQELKEQLMAELAAIGFDGFEETEEGLKSYTTEANFNENELGILLASARVKYEITIIQKQNWNKLWESNFEPVVVDDFVSIRADFHEPIRGVEHEMIITPKMSFGTGHHATTFLMMQLMRELEFTNKTVFDFGTGTGILAILAEKLGGGTILAVDNDDWCIENAQENIEKNNCTKIVIQKVENAALETRFDIVIANINKHIILENLQYLNQNIVENGPILLSGLLQEDEPDIMEACTKIGWLPVKTIEKSNWIAIWFIKQPSEI